MTNISKNTIVLLCIFIMTHTTSCAGSLLGSSTINLKAFFRFVDEVSNSPVSIIPFMILGQPVIAAIVYVIKMFSMSDHRLTDEDNKLANFGCLIIMLVMIAFIIA